MYGVYFKLQGFAFLPIIGMNNGMCAHHRLQLWRAKARPYYGDHQAGHPLCHPYHGGCGGAVSDFSGPAAGHLPGLPEMLAIGVPALRILSLCFLIGGFTIVASSVFQALGKGLLSMSISVFRQLILVLPLAYALSLTGELNMVWWSFPIAEVPGRAAGAVLPLAGPSPGDSAPGRPGLSLLTHPCRENCMY